MALPLAAGAVHVTIAELSPGDADTPVGASGTRLGTTGLVTETGPVPMMLVAVTSKV